MRALVEVYEKMPEHFSPKVEVAGIYVSVRDKILLLQLSELEEEKGAWGVPAGKLEPHENSLHAAKRELFEETGIQMKSDEAFNSLGMLYVRKPALDYVYHLFSIHLDAIPSISLSDEHCAYTWVSQEQAEALPLMHGAKQALDVYYRKIDAISKKD